MRAMLAVPVVVVAAFLGAGCASKAEKAFALSPRSTQERQIESRRFEGTDQVKLLVACQALLQDMGYHTDESEAKLGLLVATADREAGSAGEVAGSLAMMILPGVNLIYAVSSRLSGKTPGTWDIRQRVKASVVVSDVGAADSGVYVVRVTFQRTVWNNEQKISKQEWLGQPELYQDFFSRLEKSIFLKANEI